MEIVRMKKKVRAEHQTFPLAQVAIVFLESG